MPQFVPHAQYDESADALYVYLSDAEVATTEQLDDLRMIDRDAHGAVVGVEFIDASDGVDLRDVPASGLIEALLSQFPFPIVV